MRIQIQYGEAGDEWVWAEALGDGQARLLEIPSREMLNVMDVVRYDLHSLAEGEEAPRYWLEGVVEPSGYRTYLAWAVLHRPAQVEAWQAALREAGIIVSLGAWRTEEVRQISLALPPQLSALAALVRFNRHGPQVELVCPLLAAHADDMERAKSDLERAVAWGGPDAELTFALAEAFEQQGEWDEACVFWERLAHALPTLPAAQERLAIAYAHLGVFPHAATAFDRAATLTDDPDHRRRLEEARDLMWDRSRL